MESVKIASGFGKSPFIYKGSGLYQIHLVKAKAIRPFIPKELRLVENLGYTLGGFYLGNYEDSYFGAFDELVVIAGIVRSGLSSPCAWSGKVLVSNDEVRDYAQKELGVLSQVANFSKKIKAIPKPGGFLNINGLGNSKWPKNHKDIHITEIKEKGATHSFNISIKRFKTAAAAADIDFNRRIISPQIKLSLPCLSGLTGHFSHQLLEYTCQFEARVRVVAAAKVSNELASDHESSELQSIHQLEGSAADMRNVVTRIVLESKPFLTFEFNSLNMTVDSPTVVFQR